MFTLKKEDPHCALTTHCNKITFSGAPTRPIALGQPTTLAKLVTPSNYNIVDQLSKTLA